MFILTGIQSIIVGTHRHRNYVNLGVFDTREAALRAEKTIREIVQRIPECDVRDGIVVPYDEYVIQEIDVNWVRNDFNPEVPDGKWIYVGSISGVGGVGGSVGMAGDNGAGSLRRIYE